jgi:hypothetical protein
MWPLESWIWIWKIWISPKKFTRFMVLEYLMMTPLKRKLYLIHTYKSIVVIWAMYVQLDLKVICRRSPKKGRPSTFYKIWSKEVHCKECPKRDFDARTWWSCGSCKITSYNFLRLMFNNGIRRFYSYFFKFSYFDFWRKWFSNCVKNCKVLSKNHKEY